MIKSNYSGYEQATLGAEIVELLKTLGNGRISAAAYDTAWVARLSKRYPGRGFEKSLEWLRRHQNEDGTWGAPLLHYHDRFASTLAAIVALREVGEDTRDERRVKRGEAALWKLVSRLGRDDSDTIGFPIITASLAQDAVEIGLDVPRPPIRFAEGYIRKVEKLLTQPKRDWRHSSLAYSLEGIWRAVREDDDILDGGVSVSASLAANAAYLFKHANEDVLASLLDKMESDGGMAAVADIDNFEIAWVLYQLQAVGAIQRTHPEVKVLLEKLWNHWSPKTGLAFSSTFKTNDLDLTACGFIVLRWGGYPVEASVFEYYEMEDHFFTYPEETNPSSSAHLRLLLALQTCPEHPKQPFWRQKAISALRNFDDNGSYWWDKWHASPYYASNLAIRALHRLDPELSLSRVKWLLKTQNDDGGWGYLDQSTPEETAYCLDALLLWDRMVDMIDPVVITQAAEFLSSHRRDQEYTPLWIAKGLYTPERVVKAMIWSVLYQYMEW